MSKSYNQRMLCRGSTALIVVLSGCSAATEPTGHPVQLGSEVRCEHSSASESDLIYRDVAVERGLIRAEQDGTGSQQQALLGVGLVVEDLDNDGDLDVVVARRPGGPQVFGNSGKGHFIESSPVFSETDSLTLQTATGFLAEDFDQDGLLDLLFFAPRGVWVSRNLGSLRFGALMAVYTQTQGDPGVPLSAVQADWDQDGDIDLMLPGLDPVSVLDASGVGNQGTADRLLERRGSRYVLARTLESSGGAGISMVGLATDRDADGDLDLLAPSLRGSFGMSPTAFYTNPGAEISGAWTDGAESLSANLPISGMGVDSADLNHDGSWDYCISDLNRLQCLLSQPDGSYSEGAQSLGLQIPSNDAEQGWSGWSLEIADLDNDGVLDLGVVAGSPLTVVGDDLDYAYGSNLLWRGGVDRFQSADAGSFLTASEQYGLVAADVDDDGRLELLSTGLNQEIQLHDVPCNEAAWTTIRLAGPHGNPRGLGAVVEVVTASGHKRQEVHGLRALAQGPARSHFGLGVDERIERLIVQWPDGMRSETESLPVNRSILVPHPSRLVGGGDTSEPRDSQADTGEEAASASMSGRISRSVSPTGDGVGELVLMVFEGNPMEDNSSPPVAWTSIEADFSEDGTEVAYRVEQVPPRDAPYSIIVFLDDDRSGSATGPNSGDLVAMESMMSFPQVTLSEPQDYEASFVLNFGVP